MTKRLQVICSDADYLVQMLPNEGLEGTAFDDDIAIVFVPDHDDPEDVAFEFWEYGDQFGIRAIDVLEDAALRGES